MSNKVFVVTGHVAHEFGETLCVFSSESLANDFISMMEDQIKLRPRTRCGEGAQAMRKYRAEYSHWLNNHPYAKGCDDMAITHDDYTIDEMIIDVEVKLTVEDLK